MKDYIFIAVLVIFLTSLAFAQDTTWVTQEMVPVFIFQSGIYMMAENLTCSENAITVEADNVTIIGNGKTIIGANDFNGILWYQNTGGSVSDLTIQNFYYGIQMGGTSAVTVKDCFLKNNTCNGIYFDNADNQNIIIDNAISNNGYSGIHLNCSSNNSIVGNFVSNNGSGGAGGIVIWQGGANEVSNNTCEANNPYDIYLAGNFPGNFGCGNTGIIIQDDNNEVNVCGGKDLTQVDKIIFTDIFQLEQNYPNPFNPQTSISYSVANLGYIQLKVYNQLGKEVITLIDEVQSPGHYSVTFDGFTLPGGIYFYILTNGNQTFTKKMILVK